VRLVAARARAVGREQLVGAVVGHGLASV
jgi:hypothetical protein